MFFFKCGIVTYREDPTTAAATTPAPPPKGVICTKNIDDKNVCGGDIGAPVFSNSTGALSLVGVVSFYPDTRPNARCMDGHYAVITQIGTYRDFVNDPTRPQTTVAPPTTAAAST
jgi:secreted trypsin-like serine protease